MAKDDTGRRIGTRFYYPDPRQSGQSCPWENLPTWQILRFRQEHNHSCGIELRGPAVFHVLMPLLAHQCSAIVESVLHPVVEGRGLLTFSAVYLTKDRRTIPNKPD
jgi:hypothetical protein